MGFNLRRARKRDDVIVDRVTGAFNRRQLDAVIASGFDTSDQPTATLLIDIDNFERYTVKKGPKTGDGSSDQVLERVSWVIMATVRTTDVVYRHNASSFCALLPATSDEDAFAVADRVRANVEKMPLLVDLDVTVSIGVATGTSMDLATTIQRATEALQIGAGVGQNRVFAGGDVRSNGASQLIAESFVQAALSPALSAELAEVFAAAGDEVISDPETIPAATLSSTSASTPTVPTVGTPTAPPIGTPIVAPLASVPFTPPSL
jgi:diguanylate cyclase (GGDEF)-like protein